MTMSKRDRRRAEAIHFYAGSNGGGKTFCAVYDTIPSLLAGRPVLSTVRLFDPDRQADSEAHAVAAWADHGVTDAHTHVNPLGLPHPLYTRWTRFEQLLDWRDGDVLADEVQGIFSSRSHHSTPHQIVNAMQQLRRADVLFRATAPSFARLDVAVREVTQALTLCTGLLKEPVPGRLWGASRLFLWRTFDARDFDEWDASKKDDKEKFPRCVKQWAWRNRLGREVTAYYDTFATVDCIEDTTEAGTCLRCGGGRRRPNCSCEPTKRREDRTRSGGPDRRPRPQRQEA